MILTRHDGSKVYEGQFTMTTGQDPRKAELAHIARIEKVMADADVSEATAIRAIQMVDGGFVTEDLEDTARRLQEFAFDLAFAIHHALPVDIRNAVADAAEGLGLEE